MPFLAAAGPALGSFFGSAAGAATIGAGGSIASSLLSKGNKQTSTSRVDLTPDQQRISTSLSGRLSSDLASAGTPRNVTPLRSAARNQITRSADGAKTRLEESLAGRGFASSGQVGSGFRSLETARLNAFSGLEGEILKYLDESSRQDEQLAIENALRFLPGGGNLTQTSRGGGSPFGQGIETFSTLFLLKDLLGGGGIPGAGNIDFGGLDNGGVGLFS